MARSLSSPLGVAGIIFVVLGILMAIIGIILVIVYYNSSKPWYIWLLLILGIVLAILGAIMMAVALSDSETPRLPDSLRDCIPAPMMG